MANSRNQRKANRAALAAELWRKFIDHSENNPTLNVIDSWDDFTRKHVDRKRLVNDQMYRQEFLALKKEYKNIIIQTLAEIKVANQSIQRTEDR